MKNRFNGTWINLEVYFKNGENILFKDVKRQTLDNGNGWLEFTNLNNQIVRVNMTEILYTREYEDEKEN